MAIVAWFAIIIVPHLALTLIGHRALIPPVFLGGVGWLAGLRVRRIGELAHGRVLLIANHVSWLDILALGGTTRAAFVASASLAGRNFFTWLCDQNDTIFIARDRRGTVSRQVEQIAHALTERRLVIFPEGTPGDPTTLAPFKSALLAAATSVLDGTRDGTDKVTIQPVALCYADGPAVAWVGDEPGLHNVMRILSRARPIRLGIRLLPALHGAQLADRKAIAHAAHHAIVHALRL